MAGVVHALVRESGLWFKGTACSVAALEPAPQGDSYIYWPEEGAEKVTCPGCAAALARQALASSGEC